MNASSLRRFSGNWIFLLNISIVVSGKKLALINVVFRVYFASSELFFLNEIALPTPPNPGTTAIQSSQGQILCNLHIPSNFSLALIIIVLAEAVFSIDEFCKSHLPPIKYVFGDIFKGIWSIVFIEFSTNGSACLLKLACGSSISIIPFLFVSKKLTQCNSLAISPSFLNILIIWILSPTKASVGVIILYTNCGCSGKNQSLNVDEFNKSANGFNELLMHLSSKMKYPSGQNPLVGFTFVLLGSPPPTEDCCVVVVIQSPPIPYNPQPYFPSP